MDPFRDAWETGYRTRGRTWGGSPGCLPPIHPGSRVLELGCGDGKTLSFLVSSLRATESLGAGMLLKPWPGVTDPADELKGEGARGSDMAPVSAGAADLTPSLSGSGPAEIVGADFSRKALGICRGRTEFASVSLVAADARSLPFRDRTFSRVLMIHLAGHLTEQGRNAMAREAIRVLLPGGSLYFAGFSRGDMREGQGTEVERCSFRRNDGTITHYFTEEEVTWLFRPLSPVRVETRRWELKVRGVSHPRAEITACFVKGRE
jgi:ubiquinone/menaquinone biosynthesis C-methylase UbiE